MSEQTSQCTITRENQSTTVDLKAIDENGDTILHLVFKNKERSQAQIIQIIEALLDRGLDINVKNGSDMTVLHLAIEHRYKDVIDFCIQSNANLNIMNWYGLTLAHYAVEDEYLKYQIYLAARHGTGTDNLVELEDEGTNFVDWMVSRGFDFFNNKNRNNQSALYVANELNLEHIIFALLKHVTDFPSIEKNQTPFLRAYLDKIGNLDEYENKRYFYKIIKIILENNKSISKNTLNMTMRSVINMNGGFDEINLILQRISSVGQISGIKSLLQVFTNKCHERKDFWKIDDVMTILRAFLRKGADINERVAYGKTIAFMWLDYQPKLEMLQFLQDCGADFTIRTNNGRTFLHLISRHSNEPGTVEFLIKKGCNVNDIDGYGNSALSLACRNGQTEVVKVLIMYGADLKYKDKFGRTLLHLAAKNHSTVELLAKYGLNVNSKDNLGQTPLHFADCDTVAKTLYTNGAIIDLIDNEGNTPLYYGMLRSNPKFFTELMKCGADIREPNAFKTATALFRNPYSVDNITSRYVMEHLVKMNAVELLNKMTHVDEEKEQKLQVVLKKCQEEVKSLKGFFVNGFTTLYDLLQKNPNRRWVYADNQKLKSLVDDVAIEQEFPNYFVLIMGCYNEAKTRQSLMNKAIDVFNQIIQFILPDLCMNEILMYISNVDLMRIIEAGRTF